MRAAQLARKEKPRYDGRCRSRTDAARRRPPVVRFRNPDEGAVVVEGRRPRHVGFDNAELDDLIIARSDGTPTYNFCVVVDDLDMRITPRHPRRRPPQQHAAADEHAAGAGREPPVYAHLPMILGPDGAKLSKRHGAVSVLEYRDAGFLPEALLNYLVRLGWSHGDQEIFTREEMIRLFDITDVNKSASRSTGEAAVAQSAAHHAGDGRGAGCASGPHFAALGVAGGRRAQPGRRRARSAGAGEDAEGDGAGEPVLLPRSRGYDEKAAKKHLTAEAARALRRSVTGWRRSRTGGRRRCTRRS